MQRETICQWSTLRRLLRGINKLGKTGRIDAKRSDEMNKGLWEVWREQEHVYWSTRRNGSPFRPAWARKAWKCVVSAQPSTLSSSSASASDERAEAGTDLRSWARTPSSVLDCGTRRLTTSSVPRMRTSTETGGAGAGRDAARRLRW